MSSEINKTEDNTINTGEQKPEPVVEPIKVEGAPVQQTSGEQGEKKRPNTSEGYDRKPRFEKTEKRHYVKHSSDDSSTSAKETTGHRRMEKPDMMPRMSKFKKKMCRFCLDKTLKIDYKSSEIVGRFITDRGKILPRRVTGTCANHQRELSAAIKRARHIALIPYLEK